MVFAQNSAASADQIVRETGFRFLELGVLPDGYVSKR